MARNAIDRVLDALRSVGKPPKQVGDDWLACCPAHEDSTPSLSISIGRDGRALIHCHAGCATTAVLQSLGLTDADLFNHEEQPQAPQKPPKHFPSLEAAIASNAYLGQHTAVYPYHSETGEVIGAAVRWDIDNKKTIRPIARNGLGWKVGAMPDPRPLYRLPEVLRERDTIYIVEGEKCADALAAIGLTATTSAGGSKSPSKTDWKPVHGREVVIIPDHDEPGKAYAEEVAALCTGVGAASVHIADLASAWPDIPDGGDIADLLGPDGPWASVENVTSAVRELTKTPAGPKPKFWIVPIDEIGEAVEPEWIWRPFIAYEYITLFTGVWKGGKTTLLTSLLRDVYLGTGLVDNAKLPDKTLIITEENLSAWARRREDMRLDSRIGFFQKESLSKASRSEWAEMIDWITGVVKSDGYRFVVVDTLPSAWFVENENDASEVQGALMPLRGITKAGAGVLLVHHPTKGSQSFDISVRGSGALPGFVDVIMQMQNFTEEDPLDPRRILYAKGRLADTEDGVVVRYDAAVGYVYEAGAPRDLRREDDAKRVLASVRELGTEATQKALTDTLDMGAKRIRSALGHLIQTRRLAANGSGRRGDPLIYRPL